MLERGTGNTFLCLLTVPVLYGPSVLTEVEICLISPEQLEMKMRSEKWCVEIFLSGRGVTVYLWV